VLEAAVVVETSELESWQSEAQTLPRRPERLRSRRLRLLPGLRARLILFFVLLLLAISVIGVFVVTRLLAYSLNERFDNQLVAASRMAADGMARAERQQLEQLRVMAMTDGVWQGLANRDVTALQNSLAPLAVQGDVQVVSAVGADGQDLLTLFRQPGNNELAASSGADYSGVDVLQKVLSGASDELGDKYAQVAVFPSGAYLLSGAPVRDPSGKLVGALLVGTRLDTLLATLKGQALADLAVFDTTGHLAATTLPAPDEGYGVLDIDPGSAPQAGNAFTRLLHLYNRDFRALYAPLRVRNAPAGALAVVLPEEVFQSTLAANRNLILGGFIAGTLVLLVLGYVLAQSIAEPLLRLHAVAAAAAGGDLTHATGLAGDDELGVLAGSLDTLVDRLRQRNSEVLRLTGDVVRHSRALTDSQSKLAEAHQQLVYADKLAAVGALTAGIANEFKQPLQTIVGATDTLSQRYPMQQDLRQELQAIRDGAVQAARLVDDLLKFTRQAPLAITRQDLRQTVADAVQLTQAQAREAQVRLDMLLPTEPLVAEHDPSQMELVLINLIHNAIQAMPGGGTASIELNALTGAAGLIVRDTGVGIAPDDLGRIFDPFYTTRPGDKPMGLGLPVAHAIVAAHHGWLDVASRPGEGSIFSVRLPLAQPNGNGAAERGIDGAAS
jgi:signal transduction histidine kinase